MKKKSVPFSFLFVTILALVLNGCGATPSPTVTTVPYTLTAVPPTLTPVPPTSTETPIPIGKTIIVTSAEDSGPGTLRQALMDATAGDIITFDALAFPPTNPLAIELKSGLPPISQGYLTLDASNAGVILDGSKITQPSASGLTISSYGNVIRGLQIVRFSENGINLTNGTQKNMIGGSRDVGSGPLGQGNLLSGNGGRGIVLGGKDTSFNSIVGNYIGTDVSGTMAWSNGMDGLHMNGASYNQVIDNLISGNDGHGIDLCCTDETSNNTISGNIIGTDASGKTDLGNRGSGIAIHDGASHNVIGLDNVIAYNNGNGIEVRNGSLNNTITQNSIYDNGGLGIDLSEGGNSELAAPFIFDFNISTRTVTGWACANCTVEIFLYRDDEGARYVGEVKTDDTGAFAFDKDIGFDASYLIASATDIMGNSSEFSSPTKGRSGSLSLSLQNENNLPKNPIRSLQSGKLADNHIGAVIGWPTDCQEGYLENEFLNLGAKRIKLSISEIEPESILGNGVVTADWGRSEFSITSDQENCLDTIINNGITVTYILSFWDKANHPQGWQPKVSRFRTQEDIQNYLEYVRFVVNHFKGRVQYYEIWNEPNNKPPLQWIQVNDYINLVRQTIPIIRQEDPDAKIVVGSVVLQQEEDRDYLFSILRSDLMPLVDVISWHAMFGVSPENNAQYYYEYPSIVKNIRNVAATHGFTGQYWGDELIWRSPDCFWCYPGDPLYTNVVASKYHARGIVMHLGMDLATQVTGNSTLRVESFSTIRNLCTIMAGAKPTSMNVEIQSGATNIKSYGFSLLNGDYLLAVWNDGIAVDEDPGIPSTLILSGYADWKATGIDVLNGVEQPLITSTENGDLIIHDFLLKDYPIIIRLSK